VYVPLQGHDPERTNGSDALPAILAARLHRQIAFLMVSRAIQEEDLRRWATLLSGFRYPEATAAGAAISLPVMDGTALTLEEKENAAGFLNRHARTDFESDFGLLAAALLTPTPGIGEALNRHPNLREKANLVQEIYGRIHTAFSRGYFEALLSGKSPILTEGTGTNTKAQSRLTEKTVRGVSVVTDFAPPEAATVFPEVMRLIPGEIKARPMPAPRVQRSLTVLPEVLSHYSEPMLRRFLKRIVLCHDLYLGPLQAAGTYYRAFMGNAGTMEGTLYLSSTGDGPLADFLYTPSLIAETVHHELSSLVLTEAYTVGDMEQWERLLPRGFTYRSDVVTETLSGEREDEEITQLSPRYLSEGFLNRYARTDLENDFNTVAAALFSGDTKFWQAFDQHTRIRGKARIVLALYARYDPHITEDYCRRLRPLFEATSR
jgi:hypothetical protein